MYAQSILSANGEVSNSSKVIVITIFIEEAFSLKSGLQKGPQKIKNLQY